MGELAKVLEQCLMAEYEEDRAAAGAAFMRPSGPLPSLRALIRLIGKLGAEKDRVPSAFSIAYNDKPLAKTRGLSEV